MNKKFCTAAAVLVFGLFSAMPAAAANNLPPNITDVNGDGRITIEDALIIAGQASAQSVTTVPVPGTTLTVTTGTVTVPTVSTTPVTNTLSGYDSFDRDTVTVHTGEPFTLVLQHTAFNEWMQPVITPVAGVRILLNGNESDFVTDASGSVTITLSVPQALTVSAKTDSEQAVAPISQVLVIEAEKTTTSFSATDSLTSDTTTETETTLLSSDTTQTGYTGTYDTQVGGPTMGDTETRKLPPAIPAAFGGAVLFAIVAACRSRKRKRANRS